MARYIPRNCPKCCGHLGVVVNELPGNDGEHIIKGYCTGCGYQLKGWRLILGRKRPRENRYTHMRKALRRRIVASRLKNA